MWGGMEKMCVCLNAYICSLKKYIYNIFQKSSIVLRIVSSSVQHTQFQPCRWVVGRTCIVITIITNTLLAVFYLQTLSLVMSSHFILKIPWILPVDTQRFFNSPQPLAGVQRDSTTQDPGEAAQQREKENKANLRSLKKLKHVLWLPRPTYCGSTDPTLGRLTAPQRKGE